jgi:hypothetical protein
VHRLLRDRRGRQSLVNARCGVLIVRMVVMPMARGHGFTLGSVSACAVRAGRNALDLRKHYDERDESGPNHALHLGLRVARGTPPALFHTPKRMAVAGILVSVVSAWAYH